MLVECGLSRVMTADGREWTFVPSFGNVVRLGNPREIVRSFARLHGGESAVREALDVLTAFFDGDDCTELVGWVDSESLRQIPGLMPAGEQVILARHLMRHAICGTDKPKPGARYSETFSVAEYVAAARALLRLPEAEALGLSMTEFQMMMKMRFPQAEDAKPDLPTREEYQAFKRRMAMVKAKREAMAREATARAQSKPAGQGAVNG